MNFGMIRYVLGWVLLCESVLLLLPGAVSLYYGESAVWAQAAAARVARVAMRC